MSVNYYEIFIGIIWYNYFADSQWRGHNPDGFGLMDWYQTKLKHNKARKVWGLLCTKIDTSLVTWQVNNIGYACETHRKLKSRKLQLDNNLFRSWQIVLKVCTEHASITAVTRERLHNDLTTEIDVMNKQDFVSLRFLGMICIATSPCGTTVFGSAGKCAKQQVRILLLTIERL